MSNVLERFTKLTQLAERQGIRVILDADEARWLVDEIARLREEARWRVVSDEPPRIMDRVLAVPKRGSHIPRAIPWMSGDAEDFSHWLPLPPSPTSNNEATDE